MHFDITHSHHRSIVKLWKFLAAPCHHGQEHYSKTEMFDLEPPFIYVDDDSSMLMNSL